MGGIFGPSVVVIALTTIDLVGCRDEHISEVASRVTGQGDAGIRRPVVLGVVDCRDRDEGRTEEGISAVVDGCVIVLHTVRVDDDRMRGPRVPRYGRMIQATLMLCDFAQVAEGKIYITGGGWSYTNRLHGYLAVLIRLPWEYAQRSVKGSVSFVDEHGSPAAGADGTRIETLFEMTVAPKVTALREAPLDGPIAIPLPPAELPKALTS